MLYLNGDIMVALTNADTGYMVSRRSFAYATCWLSYKRNVFLLLIYFFCWLSLIDVFQMELTEACKRGNKNLPATCYVSVICTVCSRNMIRWSTKPYDLGVSYYNKIRLVYVWLDVVVSGCGFMVAVVVGNMRHVLRQPILSYLATCGIYRGM